MREICTSGSVGGLGRPIVAASGLPDAADDPPDACALPHRERRTTANEEPVSLDRAARRTRHDSPVRDAPSGTRPIAQRPREFLKRHKYKGPRRIDEGLRGLRPGGP
jgi:hypothetical protein